MSKHSCWHDGWSSPVDDAFCKATCFHPSRVYDGVDWTCVGKPTPAGRLEPRASCVAHGDDDESGRVGLLCAESGKWLNTDHCACPAVNETYPGLEWQCTEGDSVCRSKCGTNGETYVAKCGLDGVWRSGDRTQDWPPDCPIPCDTLENDATIAWICPHKRFCRGTCSHSNEEFEYVVTACSATIYQSGANIYETLASGTNATRRVLGSTSGRLSAATIPTPTMRALRGRGATAARATTGTATAAPAVRGKRTISPAPMANG